MAEKLTDLRNEEFRTYVSKYVDKLGRDKKLRYLADIVIMLVLEIMYMKAFEELP